MPVVWENRSPALIVTLIGDYSFAEVAAAVNEALADPGFTRGSSLLLDARLSEASPSSAELHARAGWIASLRSKGLASICALVPSQQPHRYGLARMLEMNIENLGFETNVFTDINPALEWLATKAPAV
jgi:hypothetical protein